MCWTLWKDLGILPCSSCVLRTWLCSSPWWVQGLSCQPRAHKPHRGQGSPEPAPRGAAGADYSSLLPKEANEAG